VHYLISSSRYEYVKTFAKKWFNYWDSFSAENESLAMEFKTILGDHTLIGESIGDPSNQHIKYYPKEEILFFTIINNYSSEICLDPKLAEGLFNKFNLSHVAIEEVASVNSLADFWELMIKLHREVLYSALDFGGEGSVIYFSS
jgi:hypothetical protein